MLIWKPEKNISGDLWKKLHLTMDDIEKGYDRGS